jgi:hypothetical protein
MKKRDNETSNRKVMDLVTALENSVTVAGHANEAYGVFSCSEGICGPPYDLPISAAFLAVTPSVARAMEELAREMGNEEPKFGLSFDPQDLGIEWRCGDEEIDATEEIDWADSGIQSHLLAEKIGENEYVPVDYKKIEFEPHGEIWFHIVTEAPGVVDIEISRTMLRKIAEGPAETSAPCEIC